MVLFKVAQPLHKVEANSTTWRLPTTPWCKNVTLATKVPNNKNYHKRKLPHKDPHKRRPRVIRFPYGNCTKHESLW